MLGEKKGFFGKLSERINDAIMMNPTIDEDFFDELEEILITSDIGMDTTVKIVDTLRDEVKTNNMTKPGVIKIRLGKIIADTINKGEHQKLTDETPLVILMIGINGGGKTTSIGKLAYKLKQEGKTVMLALSPRNMERFQYDDCVVRMRMWPVVGVAVAGAVFAGELIAIIAGVEQYVYWGAGLMALEAAIALLCLFYIRVYDRYPCVQIDANAAAAEDKTA